MSANVADLSTPQNGFSPTQYGFAIPANECCSTCAVGRMGDGRMPGFDYNCVYRKSSVYAAGWARCFYEPSRYGAKKATNVAEKAT